LEPWAVITRTSLARALHLALDHDVQAGEVGDQGFQVAHPALLGGQDLGQELVQRLGGLLAQAGQHLGAVGADGVVHPAQQQGVELERLLAAALARAQRSRSRAAVQLGCSRRGAFTAFHSVPGRPLARA
jgi:hypothetical protein